MSVLTRLRLAIAALICLGAVGAIEFTLVPSVHAEASAGRAPSGLPITRAVVLAKAIGMTGIIQRFDRAESKLGTLSDFLAAQPNNLKEQSVYPTSKEVWLVAMSGKFHAMFSPIPVPDDNWIVVAYDSTSGQPIAMMTGNMSAWPANWASILDRATR